MHTTEETNEFNNYQQALAAINALVTDLNSIRDQIKNCQEDDQKTKLKNQLFKQKNKFMQMKSTIDARFINEKSEQHRDEYDRMTQTQQSLGDAENHTDRLNASKQHAEERIKQELGMHHILPTRPEELHKIILIYVAIFKIYFASSKQQKCDELIKELQDENTRVAALKKAKTFFNEESIKGAVQGIEQLIHTTFDRFHAGALIKTMSRFISYPFADFLLVTGLSDCFLPSDESQSRSAPAY